MARGTIYSFVRSIQDAIIVKPDGYNKSIVTAKLDEYEDVMVDKDKQANVISIMLEAYNDFSDFNEVELVADPYVAFHELQENSYHGKLFTNIFAAGTIQTERSFLTGYSDSTYKERNVTSYVRYFNDLGYYIEAMHPCYGWFYNRRNIEIYLEFDNFLYYENTFADVDESELEEETYHGLLSDYDFFDYIIQGYEDAASQNQKYFNFSVTYQNHGPYETESDTDETEEVQEKVAPEASEEAGEAEEAGEVQEEVQREEEQQIAEGQNDAGTTIQDGWSVDEDGNTCYYKDGVKLTGQVAEIADEDGTVYGYYFEDDGALFTDGTR